MLKSGRLSEKIDRAYLIKRGPSTVESIDHEDYTKNAIGSGFVKYIYRFPRISYMELTSCEDWIENFKWDLK